MGRASKRKEPREILGVLYNRSDSILYGCILFFKYRPGGNPPNPTIGARRSRSRRPSGRTKSSCTVASTT